MNTVTDFAVQQSLTAPQCNITTKGVRKVKPPVCVFTPRQGIEMKRKTKCSSECVLWLCSSLFHVASRHTHKAASAEKALRAYCSSTTQALLYIISSHVTRIRRAANNWKYDGAKSGLWAGCQTTSNAMFFIAAVVAALVRDLTSSCWKSFCVFPGRTRVIRF